jgi:Spy/CpxP family protein refolding chaperone
MMGPGMMGCPMMQMRGGMMEQQREMGPMRMMRMDRARHPEKTDLMGLLHRWGRFLLARKDQLAVTPDQLERIESLMMDHIKYAIPRDANREVLLIEIVDFLAKERIDLSEAEKRIRGIESVEAELDIEGVRVFRRILEVLTPEQQKQARSMFREFSLNRMMGMPSRERAMTPDEAPKAEPEKTPQKGSTPHGHGAPGSGFGSVK